MADIEDIYNSLFDVLNKALSEQREYHASAFDKDPITAQNIIAKTAANRERIECWQEVLRELKTEMCESGLFSPDSKNKQLPISTMPTQKAPEQPLPKPNMNISPGLENNQLKIGERVRTAFAKLFAEVKLSDDELSKLCQYEYSKKVFNLNLPALRLIPDGKSSEEIRKDKNGHNRYYRDTYYIRNSRYVLCSQWWSNQRQALEEYLRKFDV